jgi:hypothetical protein
VLRRAGDREGKDSGFAEDGVAMENMSYAPIEHRV